MMIDKGNKICKNKVDKDNYKKKIWGKNKIEKEKNN
jgi:hypothetical protein